MTPTQRTLVRQLGLDVEELGLWATEYQGAQAKEYLVDASYQGWVFTSQKAVEAIRPFLEQVQGPPAVAAVGPKTRASLESLGLRIMAYGLHGVALAESLVKQGKEPLVFFCGEIHRPELPQILRSAGITLDEVVVYRTLAKEMKPLSVGGYEVLLFFSPRAVTHWMRHQPWMERQMAFAIGPSTAQTFFELTGQTAHYPPEPTVEAVLTLVAQTISNQQQHV